MWISQIGCSFFLNDSNLFCIIRAQRNGGIKIKKKNRRMNQNFRDSTPEVFLFQKCSENVPQI